MKIPIQNLCVKVGSTIHDVIACIDRGQKGIAMITDAQGLFLNTITDGDIRRAMLAGENLDAPLTDLLEQKKSVGRSKPITASIGTPEKELLGVMKENSILQIPLLNPDGSVAGLTTMDELLPDQDLPLQAVIMAGGFGKRLRPLTEDVPKPMLPVGDRPLMELIIGQLRSAGIRRVNVTTHYLPESITNHFGDGRNFGVEIKYVAEERPLGTAGSLKLLETPKDTLLVINGDILTQIDFRSMLAFHREHEADLTVAVRRYEMKVPFGVIDCEGVSVTQVREKPLFNFFVNAGIYLIEPSAHRDIPSGQCFDMTDLIDRLIESGRRVVSFPVREYWLDIGKIEDYQKAQEDVERGEVLRRL